MRKFLIYVGLAALHSACTIPMGGLGAGYGSGLQIYPSSSSVAAGQALALQVSGGSPPYQYQVSGDGTVDTSGGFQAGASAGAAQVGVTDSVGNRAYATISVLQASYYTPYGSSTTIDYSPAYDRLRSVGLDPASGWAPTNFHRLVGEPLLRGQLVASDEKTRPDGSVEESEFIDTSLKHPIVRVDKDVRGGHVVATRTVVEDQFVAKLRPGYTQTDLIIVLRRAGAHVSQNLDGNAIFLVSMGGARDPATQGISSGFLAKREALVRELSRIAVVSPRPLPTRGPSSN